MNIPKEAQIIREKLKDAFKIVHFEEAGHKYTIDGYEDKPIKSVSSLLKHFYTEFDSENIAPRYAAKYGFTTEQVLAAWDGEALKATDRGSLVHLRSQEYVDYKFFGIGEKPLPIDKQHLGAIQFINSFPPHLVPVFTELSMVSVPYWYTGTADIIAYNLNSLKLNILDYKTNLELTSEYDQEPLLIIPPKYGLKQDSFGKYSIQFSLYQILLEDMTGMEVENRVLIHLREDKPNKKLYKTYRTPDLTKELRAWLKTGKHLN
jgi:hypothetical protein